MKYLLQNEKGLFGFIGFNGIVEWVRHTMLRYQPEASALLTWLQIIVAVLTIIHLVRKYLTHRKTK